MSTKTAISILVVAAFLVGFIFLFEKDSMTTHERIARKGRVFTDFNKDQVTLLILKGTGGQQIQVEKIPTLSDDSDKWRIRAPRILDADASAVREILSALDFLIVDRAVEGADKIKDPTFALNAPRIEGSVTVRDKVIGFKVGADAQGEKVYFFVTTKPNTVFAVNADIVSSLDKQMNDLRAKKLVRQPLENVSTATLTRPLGTVSFKRTDDLWQVAVGNEFIEAAADQARALVRLVSDLEASRFIADGVAPTELSKYGLDTPSISINVTTEKGDTVAVRVGAPCAGAEGETYVTVENSGTVACAKDDFKMIAERPMIRFQETRPVVVQPDDVVGLTITQNKQTLAMQYADGKWIGNSGSFLDADVVGETLKMLTESRATQIDVGKNAVKAFKGPTTTVVLSLADDEGTFTLTFVKGGNQVKMRRGEEMAILTVPEVLLHQLTPDLLHFRSRELLDKEVHTVSKLVITGPISQTLEKQGGTWQLTSPMSMGADSGTVRKLAELIAGLKVDRFVSSKAVPAHGFQAPYATISATFSGHDHDHDHDHDPSSAAESAKPEAPQTVVLEIGAKNGEGKRFARLRGTDTTVFLIDDDFDYAITHPLIARDVLQFDETDVSSIAITAKSGARTYKKEGGIWKGIPEAPIDEDALKRLLADAAGVKTISASAFGTAKEAFSPPLYTLVFQTAKEAHTVLIGNAEEQNTDGYLARKQGIEATFVVPKSLIEAIDALINPAAPEAPNKP